MNELPLISFKGKIHLLRTDDELRSQASEIALIKQFGFDTETRPSFKKGEVYKVSLLQLATENTAYLIRLKHITQFKILQDVFENTEVLKTGVAIRDDIRQLQKIFKFEAKNFVELQDLAKQKKLKNFGLQGMTEEVLQSKLSKKAKITNWDAAELTPQQVLYAATDAWVGLELYRKISELK